MVLLANIHGPQLGGGHLLTRMDFANSGGVSDACEALSSPFEGMCTKQDIRETVRLAKYFATMRTLGNMCKNMVFASSVVRRSPFLLSSTDFCANFEALSHYFCLE